MAEAAQAETEVTDAPVADAQATDLDSLLAEFDQATKADQPADQSGDAARQRELDLASRLNADTYRVQAEIDSRRSELEQQEQHLRAQEDARDEIEAFKQIRGSLDISDEDLQGFVFARALKDPAINSAWLNRRDNPAAFNRVVANLRSGLEEHEARQRQKYANAEATADHFALAQAMRGQGGKVPPEPGPDFGRMSDREFQQWKNENMR